MVEILLLGCIFLIILIFVEEDVVFLLLWFLFEFVMLIGIDS